MKKEDYYTLRNERLNDKTDELLACLPPFCTRFVYGISNNSSSLTRINYVYDLRIFFEYISQVKKIPVDKMELSILDEITALDIERFLSYLGGYKTARGNVESCDDHAKARKLASLRAMYRYFFQKDMIAANVAEKIATPKIKEKSIVRLENDEVEKLLEFAGSEDAFSGRKKAYHNKLKVRDTAILTLFIGTGIRISELVGLNVDSFDFEHDSFIVTRKGGKQEILYFGDEVKDALFDWIDYRYDLPVPEEENAMFLSLKGQRISVRAVEVLVKKYAKEVTPLKKITPHKLRSTFGTNLYRETGDIYAVADFLGHKDVNTTRKHYAAIAEDSRKNAAKAVKIPRRNQDQES
ncbi:MAG: tyrosine-type recombinase/integrase [Candidatus Borkfalkiaceae bacterium]|nr:tyrosine-type recombinase/integrase [Christensenellaceae bacterium]